MQQITRRDRADARRYLRAIGQFADPDRDVGVLVHQMNNAIGEQEIDVDLRIVREKIRNHRHVVQAPVHDGRGDLELAFRGGVFSRRSAVGFSNFFEKAPAGGHGMRRPASRPVKAGASCGEADASSDAIPVPQPCG